MLSWASSSPRLRKLTPRPMRLGVRELTLVSRRFKLPLLVDPYVGAVDAVAFGPPCPQQKSTPSLSIVHDPLAGVLVSERHGPLAAELSPSEDCKRIHLYCACLSLTMTSQA